MIILQIIIIIEKPFQLMHNENMEDMDDILNFAERRPQRLCHMCGRCCRVAVPSVPYEKLKEMAAEKNQEALDFLELFEPYESLEAALAVDEELVKNIPDYKNRTFFRCRYLKGNLCGRYESRLEVCKRFPNTAWALVPPHCGFLGWMFLEREKIMKYVRGLKEEQLQYKVQLKLVKDEATKATLKKLIESIDSNIAIYHKYGSERW